MTTPTFESWIEEEGGFDTFLVTNDQDNTITNSFFNGLTNNNPTPRPTFIIRYESIIYTINSDAKLLAFAFLNNVCTSTNPNNQIIMNKLSDLLSQLGFEEFKHFVLLYLGDQYKEAAFLLLDNCVETPFCCLGFEKKCQLSREIRKLLEPHQNTPPQISQEDLRVAAQISYMIENVNGPYIGHN